ncbi:MAG: hypothetical protein A3F40_02470 [Chlamydiae bacterium RIFCSPHIGHO2_12_FULL_27_8]|nr:MAG: hypothetical protein A3F40_02470 [Chlamydiae bacterium RIFCSPHIGHO2_12_FULL_27_8]
MASSNCCHCKQSFSEGEASRYGLHEKCFRECFETYENFVDLIARSQSAPLRLQSQGPKNISFFHGSYRKYSASLGKTSYILKVQQKEYPELPATEFLSNQIFRSLRIQVPDHYLIKYPEDNLCFVTKNFMSDLSTSTLDHIYHFIDDEKKHDCESLVAIIGEKTQRKREQERFVFLTLADSLIGNHDRHGRNLAFIRSPKGIWLSPFYDNPSALALEDSSILGADLQPRGSIFTKHSDKPTMKDYVLEWSRLGYSHVIRSFKKKLHPKTIKTLVENSFISEKRKQALLRLISKRIEELCKH